MSRVEAMECSLGELKTVGISQEGFLSFDQFFLMEKALGQSGLYRGYDKDSSSPVLLKKVLSPSEKGHDNLKLLQESFKRSSNLAHPHLASLKYLHQVESLDDPQGYEWFSKGDFCVLLDDFEGVHLDQWLATLKGRRLEEPQALKICEQLSQVLDYLHSQGIDCTHIGCRDLYLTSSGEVKLLALSFLNTISVEPKPTRERPLSILQGFMAICYELLTGEPMALGLLKSQKNHFNKLERRQSAVFKKFLNRKKHASSQSCSGFYEALVKAVGNDDLSRRSTKTSKPVSLCPLEDLSYKKVKALYDKSLSVWALSDLLIFLSILLSLNVARGELNYNTLLFSGLTLAINIVAIYFLFKRDVLGRYFGMLAYGLLFTSVFTAILGFLGVYTFLTASKMFGKNRYHHKELKKEFRYRKHNKLFN